MPSARKFASLVVLGVSYGLLVDYVLFMLVGVNPVSIQVAMEDPFLWLYLAAVVLGSVAAFRLTSVPDLKHVFARRRTGAAVLGAPLLIVGLVIVILLIIGGLAFLWLLATSPILQIALGIAIVVLAGAAALILYTKARYG